MALDRDSASCAKCSWAPKAQDTSRSDAVVGRQAQRRQGEALRGGKAAWSGAAAVRSTERFARACKGAGAAPAACL